MGGRWNLKIKVIPIYILTEILPSVQYFIVLTTGHLLIHKHWDNDAGGADDDEDDNYEFRTNIGLSARFFFRFLSIR